jgi:hypothetical protein
VAEKGVKMKAILMSLTAVLVSATAFGQDATDQQKQILNYVAVMCSSKEAITQGVTSQGGTQVNVDAVLQNKEALNNGWKAADQAINAGVEVVKAVVASKQDPSTVADADKQTVSDAIQVCQTYAVIQPALSIPAFQPCVDSQGQTVDFSKVEAACSALGEELNKVPSAN